MFNVDEVPLPLSSMPMDDAISDDVILPANRCLNTDLIGHADTNVNSHNAVKEQYSRAAAPNISITIERTIS